MAVKLESTIRRYIGRSDDQKPLPGLPGPDGALPSQTDLMPGSSFLETDTGRIWRFNGSEWTYGQAEDLQLAALEELVAEVREIKTLFEIIHGNSLQSA